MAASMIVRRNSRPMAKIEVTVIVKVLLPSKHELDRCIFRSHGYGDG